MPEAGAGAASSGGLILVGCACRLAPLGHGRVGSLKTEQSVCESVCDGESRVERWNGDASSKEEASRSAIGSPRNLNSSISESRSRAGAFRGACSLEQDSGLGRAGLRARAVEIGPSFLSESLILAQNERWRRGLGMQVERESFLRETSTAANWLVTGGERALQPGITPGNRS